MIDLPAIRARAEAATKGPWETSASGTKTVDEAIAHAVQLVSNSGGPVIYGVWCPEHPLTVIGDDRSHPVHAVQPCTTGNGPNSEANSIFIAHARADIPALLEEVERLRKLVKDAEWAHGVGFANEKWGGIACPWCRQHNANGHTSDCPAFTPEGEVR